MLLKKVISCGLLPVLCILMGQRTEAQDTRSMISGVVVDEQNKLVTAALLKITHGGEAIEVRVSEDGMYYSPLLEQGTYRIDIYVAGKHYKPKRLSVYYKEDAPPRYYNFRLQPGEKADLYVDGQDPLKQLQAGEYIPQKAAE